MLESSEAAILDRVFQPDSGDWPKAAAEAILSIAFDQTDRERMDWLLEKAKAEELSADEAEMLEHGFAEVERSALPKDLPPKSTAHYYFMLWDWDGTLERIDTKEQDIVVMSARVSQFGTASYDLSTEQIFSDYEQQLFTRAVSVAEGFGKHVSLLVVPARDVWSAIVQTANNLEASAVVSGLSSKMTAQEQAGITSP